MSPCLAEQDNKETQLDEADDGGNRHRPLFHWKGRFQVVLKNFTQGNTRGQSPYGYTFLETVLDGLDDDLLLDILQNYRWTGRQGYSLRAMWRAYLSKFILKIRYNKQLLERLRDSGSSGQFAALRTRYPAKAP